MFVGENFSALLTRPFGPNIIGLGSILKLINPITHIKCLNFRSPVSKLQVVFQGPMKIQTATSSWVSAFVLTWPIYVYYSIIFAVLFISFFWQSLFIWSHCEMGFSKEQFLARLQVYFFCFCFLVPKFSFLMLYFTFSSSGYSLFCFYIHFSCAIATIKSLLCTWFDWK